MSRPEFVAAARIPLRAARRVTAEGRPTAPSAVTEHAKLTAGTADLWRELVHLCWETPL